MVCRCPRCVQQLGPQGDRRVPAAKCGAAGAPAPLSQNRAACRSREQRGIGSVCASALCCHPADLPLSTSLCTHGKNIGKLGTGKRRRKTINLSEVKSQIMPRDHVLRLLPSDERHGKPHWMGSLHKFVKRESSVNWLETH